LSSPISAWAKPLPTSTLGDCEYSRKLGPAWPCTVTPHGGGDLNTPIIERAAFVYLVSPSRLPRLANACIPVDVAIPEIQPGLPPDHGK
jgi:hypothetical protein